MRRNHDSRKTTGTGPHLRRGFTFVETMVVCGLVALLCTIAYGMRSRSRDEGARLDQRIATITPVVLLRSYLAYDLQAAVPGPSGETVTVTGGDSPTLSLHRVSRRVECGRWDTCLSTSFDPIGSPTPVVYRFDRDTGLVYRNDRPVGFTRFREVDFQLVPHEAGTHGESLCASFTVASNRGLTTRGPASLSGDEVIAMNFLLRRKTRDKAFGDLALACR